MSKIKLNKAKDKTIEDCFNIFLQEHCILNNMRQNTIRYYKQIMQYSFYKYIDKNTLVSNLTQQDLDNYVIYLKNRNIKDTTINIYLKAIRCILNFFKSKNFIDNNIKVCLVKENTKQIEPYTDEEIKVLLKKPNLSKCTFTEYRNWVIVNFLCNTACRRTTLINICIEDLDLEDGYCKFRHTKNRKPLTVPITVTMCCILREYIEYLPKNCQFLFPNTFGKQLSARTLSSTIDKYNHSRGVERTGIHKFRHWFAKTAVMNGMDLITLQKILGHSNLDVLKHYVNLLTKDIKYNSIQLNPLETIKKQNNNKRITLK